MTQDWKQEQQPEDNGHPNRDKTSAQTDRETGRQTDKDGEGCPVVGELDRESRAGMQEGGRGQGMVGVEQDRSESKSKIKRKRH